MKISRKLEYACRVMAQLGRCYDRGNMVHIETLSAAEVIPSNYLVQILNELRLGGVIISKRGKQGGYALAKSPHEITLCAIVEAVDPEFLKAPFENIGQSGSKVSQVWGTLRKKMLDDLSSQTLDTLMSEDLGSMYHI